MHSCPLVHMFAFSRPPWDSLSQLLAFIRQPPPLGLSCLVFLKKSQRCLSVSEPENAALSEGWRRRSYQAFPGAVTVTPSPAALLLKLPGQNSRIDDESVAFCPFRGPRPPLCGLKSFHSHSCHSRFCCGGWPWLSCLIQKQTRAKENRLGVYFFSPAVVF